MTGPQGIAGAAGAPGVGVNGLFGDGSDGDVTISSATTLTRDSYYHNLTIAAGQALNPGGYRIFVSGTLTLNNGAIIARNGNNGSGNTGGPGLASGTLGGSGSGSGGSNGTGGSVSNSLGGNGDGGGSGSGTEAGGGGVVVVAARTVTSSGAAAITARGGDGTSDGVGFDTGYGGGGGGGVVVIISTTPQPGGVTLSAAGGSTASVAIATGGSRGFHGLAELTPNTTHLTPKPQPPRRETATATVARPTTASTSRPSTWRSLGDFAELSQNASLRRLSLGSFLSQSDFVCVRRTRLETPDEVDLRHSTGGDDRRRRGSRGWGGTGLARAAISTPRVRHDSGLGVVLDRSRSVTRVGRGSEHVPERHSAGTRIGGMRLPE
jgi:hypothetical protein